MRLLKPNEARNLIRRLPGVDLNGGAVRVREVTPGPNGAAEAVALVRTAFMLEEVSGGYAGTAQGASGKGWRVVEVRVGDRRWEDVALLARADGSTSERPQLLADVEALTPVMAEKQRQQRANAREASAASERNQTNAKEEKDDAAPQTDAGETRGAVTAKLFSPLLSSATLEAEVEMGFRFTRASGRWRVSELRVGGGEWRAVETLLAAIEANKAERAREDLRAVSAALEDFRRERGFYVAAKEYVVLSDHLSPRYAARVVRVDPWHRPYRYTGTAGGYVLSSDGPDGKRATADDITLPAGGVTPAPARNAPRT